MCVCPVQPVVEASLWVLRLVLTLCENLLPQHHKLRVLALPDLTRLAVTSTVRTAMPSALWTTLGRCVLGSSGLARSGDATCGA